MPVSVLERELSQLHGWVKTRHDPPSVFLGERVEKTWLMLSDRLRGVPASLKMRQMAVIGFLEFRLSPSKFLSHLIPQVRKLREEYKASNPTGGEHEYWNAVLRQLEKPGFVRQFGSEEFSKEQRRLVENSIEAPFRRFQASMAERSFSVDSNVLMDRSKPDPELVVHIMMSAKPGRDT
ncbi:MAG TPA: hypothetical protein VI874_02630 [Candidatus Norongarragalinales archaeon]|nr:hypothetical protein [Candidatus Norongarragalinales archaeon]